MKCFLLLLLPFAVLAQTPRPLGKPINTNKYTEYAPTISADGKTLVFQSNNNPYRAWYLYQSTLQTNGKWSKPKVIESVRKYAKQPNEANGYQTDFIAAPHLRADGQVLYFSATFHSGLGGRDIYFVTKNADGTWSQPRNAGRAINTAENEDFPSIAPDGKALYFARPIQATKEGQGCYRLFVADRANRQWQRARSLPYPINTGCEKCPRIQADGVTLLFSSIRTGSTGHFDLYKAVLGIRGKRWEQLQAAKEINSPGFEQFATVLQDNSRLYYNTSGKKTPDIFSLSPVPDYLHLQKIIVTQGSIAGIDPNSQDQTKKIPLKATIETYLVEKQEGSIREQKYLLQTLENDPTRQGAFQANLRKGHQYLFKVKARGYEPQEVSIDLQKWEQAVYQIQQPIVLIPQRKTSDPALVAQNRTNHRNTATTTQPSTTTKPTLLVDTHTGQVTSLAALKKQKNGQATSTEAILKENPHLRAISTTTQSGKGGTQNGKLSESKPKEAKLGSSRFFGGGSLQSYTQLKFPHLRFAYKSASINALGKSYLKGVLEILKSNPSLSLLIEAHTDYLGTPATNQSLSEERAQQVKQYFTAQGIAPSRLVTKGYGATQPLTNRLDETSRAQNRRVVLKIIQAKK